MNENVKIWYLPMTPYGHISWEVCLGAKPDKPCYISGSYVCKADTVFQSRTFATSCAHLLELVTGTRHKVDDVYSRESQGPFKEMVHTHLCDHRVVNQEEPMAIQEYLITYTRFSQTEPPGLLEGLAAFFSFDAYWTRRAVVSEATGVMQLYLAKLE